MGVLAVRLQALNKALDWDGDNMRFVNINASDELTIITEEGFSITDGRPSFSRPRTAPLNASAFAEGLIRTRYRDGWSLPPMPS